MAEWPWPEDRLERRTRIATLYRDALAHHAPDACQQLDDILDHYGQHWLTGNKAHVNPDEPMTVKEIADWYDVKINAIYMRIKARNIAPDGGGRYRKTYRLADFEPTRDHQITDNQTTPV